MTTEITRVLIADDHSVVCTSLKALLESEDDIEVVATAENGREAIELAQAHKPDVIVMDLSMPVMDGIRATSAIQAQDLDANVIILSMHYNKALVHLARKNGAVDYIVKQDAISKLIPAVRAAHKGTLKL